MTKRNGRCLCGLRIALHFKRDEHAERFLSCAEARKQHPTAKVKSNSFRQMLRNSGAK